jgi:hypothetical protein
MAGKVDRGVLATFALVVALTTWIPLPLLDRLAENAVRRRMTRAVAVGHGVELDDEAVKLLSDTPSGGCVGCLVAVVLWPIKKVLKFLLTFLQFKDMADLGSDAVHRGLLLAEALEQGWLPGDAQKVREAMDRALARVETRPVERTLRGIWREEGDWKPFVAYATERDRKRQAAGGELEEPSEALQAALTVQGLLPELVHAFRVEMGMIPRTDTKVGGVIEPAEVLPAEPKGELAAHEAIEDAHEVVQLPQKKDEA